MKYDQAVTLSYSRIGGGFFFFVFQDFSLVVIRVRALVSRRAAYYRDSAIHARTEIPPAGGTENYLCVSRGRIRGECVTRDTCNACASCCATSQAVHRACDSATDGARSFYRAASWEAISLDGDGERICVTHSSRAEFIIHRHTRARARLYVTHCSKLICHREA